MLGTGLTLFSIAVAVALCSVIISIILHFVGKGDLDKLFTLTASAFLIIIILCTFGTGLKIINGFMVEGYDLGPISDAIRAFEVFE